jgi:hypothetical protein
MHTVGLVLQPIYFEVETNIEKLKRCKLSGIDQFAGEFSEIHKLMIYIWKKKSCHSGRKNLLLYLLIIQNVVI